MALLLGSLAIVLAVGELGARWLERAEPASREPRAPQPPDDLDGPTFHSMLEISRPDLDGQHNGVPFRTNAEGVRGPAVQRRGTDGVTRILVIGDSVTMGSGVLEADAYPMQVVPLLDRRVETINGGLSGLNAGAVMDRFDRLDAAYAPDLVVYGFTVNDIEGPDFEPASDPGAIARLWARAARFKDSSIALLRWTWPRWVMFQERISPTLPSGEDALVHNYFANPKAWTAIESALDRMQNRIAPGARCGAVFIHTHLKVLDPHNHPYLDVYARVADAARARNLVVIESFAHFEDQSASALRVSFLDPHPDRRGHALLAEALSEGLRALPDRCWRSAAAN